ncbi:DUF3177 family protein [Phormidium sp. CCY1219]|uniref:DUF3177 family protein n=1 Tax=Phormidium sp. CCY1219 TaxID=2886104 RepID=UPI002D1F45A3|nr:DUF3177 family protein [Phormidium sp. CCY1219]MEB3826739.1 DUF3177 family protein [Phormidium sp. CCY1219]
MEQPWFQPLVWMDYRLAVVFTVILPLVLLIWAFAGKSDAIQHLLVIYWRVASLLLITVYLMIGALPISFISALAARILIPVSLWFWVDINEDIDDQSQSPLKLAFTSWRWAITVYMAIGSLVQLPFLSCAFSSKDAILATPYCRVWLDPPWGFKQLFHTDADPAVLGFFGLIGLTFYVLCFAYFLFIRLGKEGRSATGH